jgi:hypothetical protein
MSELSLEVPTTFTLTSTGEDLLESCDALKAAIIKAAISEIESHSNELKMRLKMRINERPAPWWKAITPQVNENLEEIVSESK